MVQDNRSGRRAAPAAAPSPAPSAQESDLVRELKGVADEVIGRDQWNRSKTGYLTGFGAVKGGFSYVGGAIGGGFAQLRRFYDGLMGRSVDDDVEAVLVDDAGERFVESMRVHGKTVEDLVQIQNNTFRGCVMFTVLAFAALLVGFASYWYSPPSGLMMLPFDLAFRFVCVAPLAAFALKWGYANWIVRRRRYDGLAEYLKSGDWAPQRARRTAMTSTKTPAAPKGVPVGRIARPSRDRAVVKRVAMVLLVAGAFFALSAPSGFAQTTTPPAQAPGLTPPQDIFKTPGEKDLFMSMLSMIAPNVGPVPGFQGQSGTATPAHTAMAQGFMMFISALFFLAGMQVAWHTISGIVATAQEGKVLGQRWHQVWAPVRVVSGVGFLAPALGGFCVAQVVVLYLIAFGGQLANLIWVPYVQTMVSGMATPSTQGQDQIATTIGQLTSTNEVLRSIFEKELCYAVAKQNWDRQGYKGGVVPDSVTWKQDYSYNVLIDDTKSIWQRMTSAFKTVQNTIAVATTTVQGQTLDYGAVCGKITVPVTIATTAGAAVASPDVLAAATFSQARKNAVSAARAILTPIASKAGQSYQNYQAASAGGGVANGGGVATNGLYFSAESSGANDAGSGSVAELKEALQSARGEYENIMKQAAVDLMNGVGKVTGGSLDQFKKDAQDGGWATAGVYYMTISRIQSSIFARASEMPLVTKMNVEKAPQSLAEALNGSSDAKPGPMPEFAKWWGANVPQLTADQQNPINPYGARAGIADVQNTNMLMSLLNIFDFNPIAKIMTAAAPNPLNPLGDIINMGHTVIDTGYVGVAALVAAKGSGDSIWGRITTLDTSPGALSIISPLLLVILMAIFAMGIVMAFVIPMIPYIMVLFFIIGMLVLTLEAMIAAPLWAFFHVRMDGQDMIDQVQKPGYQIAFNLLLRPALMMLGYIMSFFAFGAVAWFINATFGSAVTAATAGYFGGPITFVVMGGMMAYLYYQAAMRCFTMIVQVPDRVTRWFGVGNEGLHEEQHGHGVAGLLVSQASGRVEGSLNPSLTKMMMGGGARESALAAPGGGAGSGVVDKPVPNGGPVGALASTAVDGARNAVNAGAQANEPQSDSPSASPARGGSRASGGTDKGGSSQQLGSAGRGGVQGSAGGEGGQGGGSSGGDGYSAQTAPPPLPSAGTASKETPSAPSRGTPPAPPPPPAASSGPVKNSWVRPPYKPKS